MLIQQYQGGRKIEYSIVNLNELESALRIDAEYFDPVYLRNKKLIERKKWAYLKDLSKEIINFGAYSLCNLIKYQKRGIPYLFVGNIKENEIATNNIKHINKKIHNLLYKSKIYSGDIVFTIAGTIGNAAVVPDKLNNINSNQAIAKIRGTTISPFYTSTFLNSKYGKYQSYRFIVSNVQPNLLLTQVKNLKIPIPSGTFQKQIEKLVLSAYKERENAEKLYKGAEDILLEELGLINWNPKTKKIKIDSEEFEEEENISIRKLPECLKVNRFDAEYWLPRYDEIENLIKNYKGGWDILKNRFNQNKTNKETNKEKEFNYIEIGSINVNSGEIKPLKLKDFELPANAKLKLNLNDILISKVRTYRGAVTFIYKELDNLVGSGAFTVLQEKNTFNKETLFVLLKTKPYLALSLKFNTGTSYPTLNDKDILNLLIPLLSQQTQSKISQKIQQSFKARRKSKELLEIAKRGVEIYIENDEQKGINYITEQL
jgi:type I restriction enzyme S subunit